MFVVEKGVSAYLGEYFVTVCGGGCMIFTKNNDCLFYKKGSVPLVLCFGVSFKTNVNVSLLDRLVCMVDGGVIDEELCREVMACIEVINGKITAVSEFNYRYSEPSESALGKASSDDVDYYGDNIIYADGYNFNIDDEFAQLMESEKVTCKHALASIFDSIATMI